VTDFLNRIAGAPITWGVDGSPGWGHLMNRDRVMEEMRDTGLAATELGPDGYLPTDADELADYIKGYDLEIVAGFVPALLYRPDRIDNELDYVTRASKQLAASGSDVLVLGASSHHDGYDIQVDMNDEEWDVFLANLRRLEDIVGNAGLTTALHPHWGMAIETGKDVERLLEACDVGLCLDTGHLYLAGTDPVDIARMASDRVHHVHLKDVDAEFAERVRSGEAKFRQSVIDGMFTPLGEGDVDIAGVIRTLEQAGYQGWYVLEQDTSLTAEPAEGEGPKADAIASVAFLRDLSVVDA
jgi:inosose dehydratase